MKTTAFFALLILTTFVISSYINRNAESTTTKEKITFYQVPLVCGADAEIGCGSRAKPALLDLGKIQQLKKHG